MTELTYTEEAVVHRCLATMQEYYKDGHECIDDLVTKWAGDKEAINSYELILVKIACVKFVIQSDLDGTFNDFGEIHADASDLLEIMTMFIERSAETIRHRRVLDKLMQMKEEHPGVYYTPPKGDYVIPDVTLDIDDDDDIEVDQPLMMDDDD